MTSTQLDEILTSVGEKSDSKMVRYSQLLNKLSDLSLERPVSATPRRGRGSVTAAGNMLLTLP
eukprot:1449698-Rhodomonas_salina.3